MTPCDVQASGAIELYFYGEASAGERASVERHLARCAECRRALEEMSIIRAALSARPRVSAPPGEDWSAFMARLDEAVGPPRTPARADVIRMRAPVRRPYVAWVAMAALLALVTLSVLFVARSRQGDSVAGVPAPSGAPVVTVETTPAGGVEESGGTNAAFLAMSEKHFERSKLVVLGLAARDAREPAALDWNYERQLASSLLTDTRLYRLSAEQRGMTTLAGVMADLELVLLQTSMSSKPDMASLEQLQRLIAKRDLVTKMEVVTAGL
jgi:anti-sigma-K factor RskA